VWPSAATRGGHHAVPSRKYNGNSQAEPGRLP